MSTCHLSIKWHCVVFVSFAACLGKEGGGAVNAIAILYLYLSHIVTWHCVFLSFRLYFQMPTDKAKIDWHGFPFALFFLPFLASKTAQLRETEREWVIAERRRKRQKGANTE